MSAHGHIPHASTRTGRIILLAVIAIAVLLGFWGPVNLNTEIHAGAGAVIGILLAGLLALCMLKPLGLMRVVPTLRSRIGLIFAGLLSVPGWYLLFWIVFHHNLMTPH